MLEKSQQTTEQLTYQQQSNTLLVTMSVSKKDNVSSTWVSQLTTCMNSFPALHVLHHFHIVTCSHKRLSCFRKAQCEAPRVCVYAAVIFTKHHVTPDNLIGQQSNIQTPFVFHVITTMVCIFRNLLWYISFIIPLKMMTRLL